MLLIMNRKKYSKKKLWHILFYGNTKTSDFKHPPQCKGDLRCSGILETTIVRCVKSHRSEEGFEKSALGLKKPRRALDRIIGLESENRYQILSGGGNHSSITRWKWNVISRPAAALKLDAEVLSLGYLADGKVNSFLCPLSLDSDDFTNARFYAIAAVSVNIKRLPRYNVP
jgi:hypothetical protein